MVKRDSPMKLPTRKRRALKQRTILPWLRFAVLCACLWSGGSLLAQEESVAASAATAPLLFTGTLNDGNANEGNQLSFTVAINAGDRITATALCEIASDGLRNVDPALTVYAPENEASLERLQWYNDDSDAVIDCVNYRSSRLSFEAPVSGDYEFIIENLAGRSGPFSLEIQGSSATQTRLDLFPEEGMEGALTDSGTRELDDSSALDADTADATGEGPVLGELVFTGLLAAKEDAESASRSYEIQLNAGDEVVAELTCEEDLGSRWLDPSLTVSYANEAGEESSWHNDDHENLPACLFYRSAGVEFTAPETAVYTFSAHNLSFYKGRYRLLIRGATAPQNHLAIPEPLWDGTSDPPGSLDILEGDLAYKGEVTHRFSLNEGERIAALVTCEASEDSRPVDPLLRILDPEGALILQVDDSLAFPACATWYSAYGEFTAAASGDYSFVVRNVAREGSGPYSLALVRSTPGALASAVIQNGGEAIATTRGDAHIGTLGEIGSIFLVETENGLRLDVYAVDDASNGLHVFSIYGDQLGHAAGRDEYLLASARNGTYSAHLLGDGSLRLSAGPNAEGKRYHMILSGIPGEIISTYDEMMAVRAEDAAVASAASLVAAPVLALHVVQPGETLYSIGVRYGVGYEAIAAANNIGPDFIIHVGAELVIPKP